LVLIQPRTVGKHPTALISELYDGQVLPKFTGAKRTKDAVLRGIFQRLAGMT